MKDYIVTWEETVRRGVSITAYSPKNALNKWRNGDYDPDRVEIFDSAGEHNVEVHEE